jgi:hypothetical protein
MRSMVEGAFESSRDPPAQRITKHIELNYRVYS